MSKYEYDVFVSYRHRSPAMDWVKNHFYPLLEQRLPDSLPVEHDVKIFVDFEEIDTGSSWPAKLRQALRVSRCAVAVWSPEYFRSEWCVAEWKTMLKREDLLGLKTLQNPSGLVYPVVFADGEHFPIEARETQPKDLRPFNYAAAIFRETQAYLEFDREIQKLAQEIAKMIQSAPDWEEWPVVTPPPRPAPAPVRPRL